MGVVVTAASGFDLDYPWRGQAAGAERTAGGYYMNAAQAGEAPGRWSGAGAAALGLAEGRQVERAVYDRVFGQEHPVTGERWDGGVRRVVRIGGIWLGCWRLSRMRRRGGGWSWSGRRRG